MISLEKWSQSEVHAINRLTRSMVHYSGIEMVEIHVFVILVLAKLIHVIDNSIW